MERMTPGEIVDFNKNGCGSRCLIELAGQRGKPMTPDEFVERFRPDYGNVWAKEGLGATSTAMLIDMAKKLRLCDDAVVRVDPALVRRLMYRRGYANAAILTTERTESEPHCLLVTNRGNNNQWFVRDPEVDGQMTDRILRDEDICGISHFLLLFD